MHRRRVRHVLGEPEGFESALAARKEGCPIVAEDDDIARELVAFKEAAQPFGTFAGIDASLVLVGSHVDDASGIHAEASRRVHELFPVLDPRLAPDPIEPELPVEREEHRWCTVYAVGPNYGDDAVGELRNRTTGLGLGAAGRCIAHAPISAVPREREIDARHEALEVSCSLPL